VRDIKLGEGGKSAGDLEVFELVMGQDGGAAEEAREHDLKAGGVASKERHQIIGNDAEEGAEFDNVPAVAAEDGDVGAFPDHWITFASDGLDERRLAAPVGTQDGDMLIGMNAQAEIVEHNIATAHDAHILQLE
jgi:hypothetical protein